MDYNGQEKGQMGTHKYDDIIAMEYPLQQHDRVKHPPMPKADRAKIFAPFSALKGHGEAIHEREEEWHGEDNIPGRFRGNGNNH